MKTKLILSIVSLAFLCQCGSVALVKRDEWERQREEMEMLRAEVKKTQTLLDAYNRDNTQQMKIMKADFNVLFTDIRQNLNLLSGQLEENKNDLQKISKTTEKLSERKYILKNMGKNPGDSTAAAAESVMVEDKVDVQKLFQIARKDFNAKDYERAKKEFEDLLARYPQDPIADDCLFWVGESYFILKQYVEAINIYKRIVKDFPQGDILPSAVFKAGLCYQKLNDTDNMKKAWNDLIQKYPYSDEAMQAKARLGQ